MSMARCRIISLDEDRGGAPPYNGRVTTHQQDAHVAVVAHGLLGTAMAIGFAAQLLRDRTDIDPARHDELLAVIEDQTSRLAAGLLELVRTGGRT